MSNVSSENLYIVEVTETLQRLVVVQANSKEEAIQDVEERYDRGNLSLGDLDVVDSSIEIYNYSHPEEMDSLLETYCDERNKLDVEGIMKILEKCDFSKRVQNV